MTNIKGKLCSCPASFKGKLLFVVVDDEPSNAVNSGVAPSDLNLRDVQQFLVTFVGE